MDQSQTVEKPAMVANDIQGYDYGSTTVARSPITVKDLEQLKESAGFTPEDERWLRAAGDVLKDQATPLVREVACGHFRPSSSRALFTAPRRPERSALFRSKRTALSTMGARHLLSPV